MEEFKVLSFDRREWFLIDLKAENEEDACEIANEGMATPSSTDVVLTLKEFEELKEIVKNG